MNSELLFARYRDLQRYVRWSDDDVARLAAAGKIVRPHFVDIIDDFYAEIQRHSEASAVITGGAAQVQRLKQTLLAWLDELFRGPYDDAYVERRARVGLRHVEIGLPHVYTSVAFARLRMATVSALCTSNLDHSPHDLAAMLSSLNKLLDLDLAVIAEVYEGAQVRRRQAEERAKMESALLQAERLAAIGQMATGLTHEARNALQRIQACAEMLELEVEDRPAAIDLVRRIQHAENDVLRLFDEVRNYAAPINLDRTQLPISSIWHEAWQLLAPQRAKRAVTLSEVTEGVELAVSVDEFRLVQVFRNVLENSLAACHDPVEIEIVCIDAQLNGRAALRIGIRDNGPGFTAEQKAKIFEPFFTTKAKGTGLGMAIAQRAVEAHGGTIAVGTDSPGAEIVITLPR